LRVIAKFDFKDSVLVKSRQLEGIRPIGPLGSRLREFANRGLPAEIWLNAITASFFGLKTEPRYVKAALAGVFLPTVFGGGIESVADAERYIKAGSDRIALNTGALRRPALVGELANEFGSQAVVASIEARQVAGVYMAFGESGRWNSMKPVEQWAEELVSRGVGELVVVSVETEGTGKGFPEELLSIAQEINGVPIVLTGGFGGANQLRDVMRNPNVDGVAVSKLAHLATGELLDFLEEKS
jgi:cyclase